MNPRIEVVAIDCLMVRLFDVIAEANMPVIAIWRSRLEKLRAVRNWDPPRSAS